MTKIAELPYGINSACIDMYYLLNRLPGVETFESCSGHGKNPFSMWFFCDNIDTLSRLGRAVSPNYSDGNWEIVIDTTDTNPRGCFWLRSSNILQGLALTQSLHRLIENILYWFEDEFDDYFKN